METQQISEPAKKKSNVKAEDIFKIVSCIFVIMWSVCLKYFFEFRSYLNVKNLNYFEFKYAWYILVGFLFMLVIYLIFRSQNMDTTPLPNNFLIKIYSPKNMKEIVEK